MSEITKEYVNYCQMIICFHAINHGKHNIAEYAIKEFKFNPNIITNDQSNSTLLHDVVHKNDIKMLEILLKLGADPRVKQKNGFEPIDIAVDDNIKKMLGNAKKIHNHCGFGNHDAEKNYNY